MRRGSERKIKEGRRRKDEVEVFFSVLGSLGSRGTERQRIPRLLFFFCLFSFVLFLFLSLSLSPGRRKKWRKRPKRWSKRTKRKLSLLPLKTFKKKNKRGERERKPPPQNQKLPLVFLLFFC
jgi:hypothetical protein